MHYLDQKNYAKKNAIIATMESGDIPYGDHFCKLGGSANVIREIDST